MPTVQSQRPRNGNRLPSIMMRTSLRKTAIVALIVACVSLPRQTLSACFAPAQNPADSTFRGPDWLRLGDLTEKDSGTATFGWAHATAGAGQWWHIAPDSVRIAAHGPFDVLAMRGVIQGDTIKARFIFTTDMLRDSAKALVPIAHIGEWIGRRRPCPVQ